VEFLKGKSKASAAGQLRGRHHLELRHHLSADKDKMLAEAFRVLKPGGRLAVSDVVTKGAMAARVRKNVLLWVGCVAERPRE